MVTERDNLTLACIVSQRKWSNSVLILRWFYSPPLPTTSYPRALSPSLSPPSLEPNLFLIAKLGIKRIKLYGNYTRRFPKPKFRLYEEQEGEVFRLWIFNVTGMDQGLYSCKVQEIRKLRNTWRASSNGTSSTQLIGNYTHVVLHTHHWTFCLLKSARISYIHLAFQNIFLQKKQTNTALQKCQRSFIKCVVTHGV